MRWGRRKSEYSSTPSYKKFERALGRRLTENERGRIKKQYGAV